MAESITSSQIDKIYDSINDMASALTGARSLSEKLGQVVAELRRITRADGTSIWLQEGKTLWCIAGEGHYENMQKGKESEAKYNMEKDNGLTVWIAKSGETINIGSNKELVAHPHWRGKYDYKNYPNFKEPDGHKCESFLGTPLKIGNDIIGVIKADNHRDKSNRLSVFSKAEERLFKILAALTAIVIKNDQIQLQASKREQKERRERAEIETRQMMAAVVVHNLNNPATGVRLALLNIERQLNMKPSPKKAIKESIRNATIQVERILATRDTFLSYIRPLHKDDFREVNIYEFVQNLIDEMRVQAPDINFRFNTQAKSKKIKITTITLRTAVNSLIQNAIEATRGLSKRIIYVNLLSPDSGTMVKGNSSARRMRLEIIDNGPGIPPEIEPKLFKAFETTKELGSGLGLFASHKIMQSVNGNITYEPDKKIGTKFVIHFPFVEGEVS
jgi:signal transduction histidine kinase